MRSLIALVLMAAAVALYYAFVDPTLFGLLGDAATPTGGTAN